MNVGALTPPGCLAVRGQNAPVANRLLNPFVAILTAILGAAYAYLALRLGSSAAVRGALALPFVLIWLVPVLYWFGDRDRGTPLDDALHFGSYVSMGWVSFALVLSLARDALLLVTAPFAATSAIREFLGQWGGEAVLGGAFLMFGALILVSWND